MTLADWIPAGDHVFVFFLLKFGLLSFVYAWVVVTITSGIGSVLSMIKIPGDGGTFLRVTLGHGLLTATVAFIAVDVIGREPDSTILYTVLAGVFLWMTFAPELYEEYASSANLQKSRSGILFIVRLLLIILWIVIAALAVHGDIGLAIDPLPLAARLLDDALSLPYSIGIGLGAVGVYSLFRCVFKTLFATAGLMGEVKDLLRRRGLPAKPLA